ncbi:DUF4290 domain-containing protein [Membranihabitans marinus]|uniref:DUF4290 domain-containing protein n=1 Tax=Membranihabitans marinus TaxID=1227546 RepID=UPI001F34ECB3|nr:DUF4290 domain-containing protein [Membranihabitans marinus]
MYNFQYNTINQAIRIPEYGRHVQNLIDYATEIEDREERQKVAERIIKIIIALSNDSKSNNDYIHKAWKHLFYMSENKLDVDLPEGIEIGNTQDLFTHETLDYPQMDINFKHYGQNVQRMLDKAIKMENPEHKAEYVNLIGSYMKMAYKTWHKEQFVNDEIIKNDIQAITRGKLADVLSNTNFDALTYKKKTPTRPQHGSSKNRNNQNNRRRRKY